MQDLPTSIYINNAELYKSEYISMLGDDVDLKSKDAFTGLIKFLSVKLRLWDDQKAVADLSFMWDIFDYYTLLCYTNNHTPIEKEYYILLGVNLNIIQDMIRGSYRPSDRDGGRNATRVEFFQHVKNECSLGRYKGAQSGSPGGIFLAKAVDGLREDSGHTATIQGQSISIETITALLESKKAVSVVQNDEKKQIISTE